MAHTIDENRCDLPIFFGNGRFFFDDGRQNHSFLRRRERQIRGALRPKFRKQFLLRVLHPFDEVSPICVAAEEVGFWQQTTFIGRLDEIPNQMWIRLHRVHGQQARETFRDSKAILQTLTLAEHIKNFDHARTRRDGVFAGFRHAG